MMAGSSDIATAPDRSRRGRSAILPGAVLDERIVEALGASDVPLSAYALADVVRGRGRSGNVMSIYRSLDRLLKGGVVERVESLSAYRLRTMGQALLMACSLCGTTTPLEIRPEYEAIEKAVRETGFVLDKLALEAVGICGRCATG